MSKSKGRNFIKSEETAITERVEYYKDIIECKKTGHIYNLKNLETWKIIENEFNALNLNGFRDHVSLRTKYENMKKRATQNAAEEMKHFKGAEFSLYAERLPP